MEVEARIGVLRALLWCGILQMLSNLMFAVQAKAGHDIVVLFATIGLENFSGGMGVKRSLPIVAKHADIWHTFASVDEYRRKNAILKDLVADVGRDESQIERAVHWTGRENADAFVGEGVTLFTTEIHPTDDGYDFTELKDMIAWRNQSA